VQWGVFNVLLGRTFVSGLRTKKNKKPSLFAALAVRLVATAVPGYFKHCWGGSLYFRVYNLCEESGCVLSRIVR